MNPRQRLAYTCQAESKAYGYTLSIWGAGALLIHQFGTPTPRSVFAYVGGGIVGFALVTLFAFGVPFSNSDVDADSEFIAATTVHIIATPGNLALSYGLVSVMGEWTLATWIVFGIVGLQATVTYNLLMLFEDSLSLVVKSVEDVTN
jgi:phosphotransferase system  glucose/maltose/N-acetylglucosamine-specific IIC component